MQHNAVSEETAEPIQNEAALATHETSEITPSEVVLELNLLFPGILQTVSISTIIYIEFCSAFIGVILITTCAYAAAGRRAGTNG